MLVGVAVVAALASADAGSPALAVTSTPPEYQVATTIALPVCGDGVAVDSARGLVYVASRAANEVVVYDEATLTLRRTIPVPNQPYRIAVGPSGVVYVSEFTDDFTPGSLAVILPDTSTIAATLPTGLSPAGVTVSNDGTKLWVANLYSAFLSVFSLANPAVPTALPNLNTPAANETVTESADGSTLFLPNNEFAVHVISAATGASIATWTVANGAHQVSFTADGSQAIVSTQLGSSAPIFSTNTNIQTGSIPIANSYYQSQDPNLDSTFITLPFDGTGGALAIVDTNTGALAQTLSGVPTAGLIATDAVTHHTFVTQLSGTGLTEVVPVPQTGPVPLSVTQNPTSQTVQDGQTATFTAASTGGVPAITAQWQVSTDGGATYANIAGATSTTLVVAPAVFVQDGNRYRAVFTDGIGSTVTTTAATLTVSLVAPVITRNPVDVTVSEGQSATFTAAASGSAPLAVQWQMSTDGGATFTDIAGANAASYTTLVAAGSDNGHFYRAVFSNGVGSATTQSAMITVEARAATPSPSPSESPSAGPSPATGGRLLSLNWFMPVGLGIVGAGLVGAAVFGMLRRKKAE